MKYFDSHTHTVYSFDGRDTVADMCKAAVAAGLSGIAFTDHCDIDGVSDGFYPPYLFKTAREDIMRAAEEFAPVLEVCYGVELGQPHARPGAAELVIREGGFDFVLGSLHNLRDVPDFSYLMYDIMPERLIDSLFERSFSELSEVARFPGVCSLAHITYPFRYIKRAGVKYDLRRHFSAVRELYRVMIDKQCALELNTSTLAEAGDTMPPLDFFRLYRDCGGELVTVGSDAHSAARVGAEIRGAYEALAQIGFRYISRFKKGELIQEKLDV